jgi:hypothetical protein
MAVLELVVKTAWNSLHTDGDRNIVRPSRLPCCLAAIIDAMDESKQKCKLVIFRSRRQPAQHGKDRLGPTEASQSGHASAEADMANIPRSRAFG